MEAKDLFTVALGLGEQWFIDKVEFRDDGGGPVLHLHLDHPKGVKFEKDGEHLPVYDHQVRKWRHLNFFQHECYLHARVPRVRTEDGHTLLVDVPWASAGSSFTLLFEAYTLLLVEGGMPMTKAGEALGILDKSVFNIISRKVIDAMMEQDLEDVEHLAIDETSSKKGHNYLTVLTDVARRKVIGVAEGKDVLAMTMGLYDFEMRGGNMDKIEVVTLDMSPSYISGCADMLPQADMVFDRFHLEKKMNEAVDSIRREESKENKGLKNTRYLWLKNHQELTQERKQWLSELSKTFPKLGLAHRIKEQLKIVLDGARLSKSTGPLEQWMKLAQASGIEQVREVVRMFQRHWYGIRTYFEHLVSNGLAERINLKIQEIKRVAKGFRNTSNFRIMIYFHLGRLDLK